MHPKSFLHPPQLVTRQPLAHLRDLHVYMKLLPASRYVQSRPSTSSPVTLIARHGELELLLPFGAVFTFFFCDVFLYKGLYS